MTNLGAFGFAVRTLAKIFSKNSFAGCERSFVSRPCEWCSGDIYGRDGVVAVIGEIKLVGSAGLVGPRRP